MNAEGSNTTIKTEYIQVIVYIPQIIPEPEGFPFANFTANTTYGKAPLNVVFVDQTQNATTYWNWTFGDGGTSTERFPVHTYPSSGMYTVSLMAGNNYGENTSTKIDYITVLPLTTPDANFTAAPISGKAPLTVVFNDTSSGFPTSWFWDFGDGTTSAGQHPVHEYGAAGNYTVSLTATNEDGSDTETRPDYIIVAPVILPVADFTANTTSGIVPLAVEFTDTSSGSPTSWNWMFGDGGTSAEQNPVHVYTTTGQFTVTLQVTNEDGSNSTTKEQFITGNTLNLPVAEFTANTTSGNAPLAVGFTDQSTGSPVSWHWSFGDGATSDEQNPEHTYTNTGIYTISLEVTNPDGSNTATKTDYITVTSNIQPPVASFTGKPTCGKAPLTVTFNDISTVSPTSWFWDFGDGTTATEQNPVHVYTTAGKYTVSLTATNAGGSNTITRTDYITVSGLVKPPVANFYGKPTSGKAPLSVKFTDTSTGSPTTWHWDFGDGTNATDRNPVHSYTSPGKYTVSLTVTNAGGSNTKTRTEYISVKGTPPPTANFYGKPTSGKAPLSVIFTDTSTGNPTGWFWDFGDGSNDTAQHPVHSYASAGKYTVSLTASNTGGNTTKTRTQYITVTVTTPTPTHTCTPSQCEPHEVPHVSGSITQDNKVRLDWDVITNPCLQGYKVVISKNNPNPKYPDDGYMFWITDRNTNYSVISSTDHYNGGDFDGYMQPGESYYFSITAVYSDTKVAGNVVELEYPA
jgi:PKD repeat protein